MNLRNNFYGRVICFEIFKSRKKINWGISFGGLGAIFFEILLVNFFFIFLGEIKIEKKIFVDIFFGTDFFFGGGANFF